MNLSTATIPTHTSPILPKGLLFQANNSRPCLVKTSTRACKSGRLAAHASLYRQSPVLKGAQIGFDPLQSRRNIWRPSALDIRCAAAETQTLSRTSSATIVSSPGKEMLPMLDDDGGSGFRGDGFTPYYRGDGSGGGSGGGGGGFPTSGEGTCVYKYEDGTNKPIRRYV